MLHSTQKQGYTVLANPTCKQLTGLNSFLKQAGRWSRETYDNQNLAIELSSPITSKHQPHIPHLHRATMECYANGGLWAGVRCPLCQGLSLTRMVWAPPSSCTFCWWVLPKKHRKDPIGSWKLYIWKLYILTFASCAFKSWITLVSCTFGNWVTLGSCTFGSWITFESCTFGSWTTFGNWITFGSCTFGIWKLCISHLVAVAGGNLFPVLTVESLLVWKVHDIHSHCQTREHRTTPT